MDPQAVENQLSVYDLWKDIMIAAKGYGGHKKRRAGKPARQRSSVLSFLEFGPEADDDSPAVVTAVAVTGSIQVEPVYRCR